MHVKQCVLIEYNSELTTAVESITSVPSVTATVVGPNSVCAIPVVLVTIMSIHLTFVNICTRKICRFSFILQVEGLLLE